MTKRGQKRRRLITTRGTEKKIPRFLALLAEGNTVSYAAQEVGFVRQTVYELRQKDPAFAEAWDEAWVAGTEQLEQEARRRAVVGTLKPVFQQGQQVGTIREYSDVLLIFLLKGRKPEVYRDNLNISGRVTNDLSGLIALARQVAPDEVAREPRALLPGGPGQDAVEPPSGDPH